MINDNSSLDELMSDDFLNSLECDSPISDVSSPPNWVVPDITHTTYRVWQSILALTETKKKNIQNYGKVASRKTPKALFEMTKAEVARDVNISAQSIFRASKFSASILDFFDETNAMLSDLHQKEQTRQVRRQINTGIRTKKKDAIVKIQQDMKVELRDLKAKTTKQVLDLAIDKMPLDLRLKLGL
ncbi:hypothetical protein J4N45_14605 [Vibrio sp. SCSIO 43140]|uniref:hypothetical protein n=1 Tax=Vibrio sp. SCSIO 43140 TaxID=2819100 RepID=UPI002075D65B|nr:hypothetical protein [Vibrio sp. SCSIO 43140]USD58781.1 hypothetical protein J4N45_09580 [Vibrio sp. SCSIO 43140]USD59115.1 hypothetical protein J4N45_11285 [Vibrio sp. SCSIO 43140]USD59731.1 hypothetical protein J4N45_14605 [Vibrio sp. SCSIO 43140]